MATEPERERGGRVRGVVPPLRSITRADLAAGLMGAMSCSPLLVRWALPLVLEKLSSTYR